jgi:hypothetical protein
MITTEIFHYGTNKYFQEIQSGLDEGKNAEERLKIFVDRAIAIIGEHSDFFKIYIEFLAKEAERVEAKEMITSFYDQYISTLAGIIRQGIKEGVFRHVEAEKLARAIYFLSIGVIFTRFVMKVDFDLADQNHFQINSIVDSIKKHA